MAEHRNRFIDDVDLSISTSLTHLLDRHDTDKYFDEVNIIKHSPYYSEGQFIKLLTQTPRVVHTGFKYCKYFHKIR